MERIGALSPTTGRQKQDQIRRDLLQDLRTREDDITNQDSTQSGRPDATPKAFMLDRHL
jgi:hypothetical protein